MDDKLKKRDELFEKIGENKKKYRDLLNRYDELDEKYQDVCTGNKKRMIIDEEHKKNVASYYIEHLNKLNAEKEELDLEWNSLNNILREMITTDENEDKE